MKVKMFVRLRKSLNSVKTDVMKREIAEMYQNDENENSDSEEFNSEDEADPAQAGNLPWW